MLFQNVSFFVHFCKVTKSIYDALICDSGPLCTGAVSRSMRTLYSTGWND